jgi:hypothetical protein
MAAEYLTSATNGMYALLHSTPAPTQRDLALAAAFGCDALGRLAGDGDFWGRLPILAARQQALLLDEHGSPLAALYRRGPNGDRRADAPGPGAFGRQWDPGQVARALQEFLDMEQRLLVAWGLRPTVVRHLLAPLQELLDSPTVGPPPLQPIDSASLGRAVEALRDATCQAAYELENDRRTGDNLWRWLWGLGGAAVVAANASALAGTLGLSAPMTAVSGALGAVLIDRAVPDFDARREAVRA